MVGLGNFWKIDILANCLCEVFCWMFRKLRESLELEYQSEDGGANVVIIAIGKKMRSFAEVVYDVLNVL